jgi:hypothetical protein
MLKSIRPLIVALSIPLIGCFGEKHPYSFEGISNRGILTLSASNPDLGGNSFLSSEMSKSPALAGFIKSRGAPHAIKVQDHKMRADELLLFYPRESSFYLAELNSTLIHYDWIVRGPFKITSFDSETLSKRNLELSGEPVLMINGAPTRIKANPPLLPTVETQVEKPKLIIPPTIVAIPTPKPTPIKKVAPKPVASPAKTTPAKVTPAVTPFKPLNFDQMAILMSQGFAERDTNGDVIHTVQKDGETLDAIAAWYAGNKSKASEIAKASGVEPGTLPSPGTRIRIPLNLVKNTKQMK